VGLAHGRQADPLVEHGGHELVLDQARLELAQLVVAEARQHVAVLDRGVGDARRAGQPLLRGALPPLGAEVGQQLGAGVELGERAELAAALYLRVEGLGVLARAEGLGALAGALAPAHLVAATFDLRNLAHAHVLPPSIASRC
jgi:hypothetical protein